MKNRTKQAFIFPETGKRKVTFHLQVATNHKGSGNTGKECQLYMEAN